MVSQALIIFLMAMVVLFGSINTITNKIINHTEAIGVVFHHVWFITFLMFFGESMCFFVYLCIGKQAEAEEVQQAEERHRKEELSPLRLSIPPLFDLCGTTMMTFGLTMLAGSVYQMFRGSVVVFTCLLSVFYLKNRHFLYHYIGLGFVVSGLCLVGVASYQTRAKTGDKTSIWGILLVILSQLFTAIQFIYEEKLMKKYSCHPIKAIGWEGIWGCCFTSVLLVVFQFIPCHNGSSSSFVLQLCTRDDEGLWTVENTLFAFRQLGNSPLLIGLGLLFTCSIAVFNVAGISVSKYSTGTARAVVDSVRTVVVWAFFLMSFLPANMRETFSWIQLTGFILLVVGSLIYNEVISLQYCISESDSANSASTMQLPDNSNKEKEKDKSAYSDKPTEQSSNGHDLSEEEEKLLQHAQ